MQTDFNSDYKQLDTKNKDELIRALQATMWLCNTVEQERDKLRNENKELSETLSKMSYAHGYLRSKFNREELEKLEEKINGREQGI